MFKKAMIAGAVVLASIGSQAATQTVLVTGTITPEACSLTVGSGNLIDYGTLSSVAVKAWTVAGINGTGTAQHYVSPAKTVPFDITCAAPTAFYLETTDNRAASKVNIGTLDTVRYGLGVTGTSNIGNHYFDLSQLQVAATVGGTLAAKAGTLTRAKGSAGAWTSNNVQYFEPSSALGIRTATTDTTPAPLAKVSGNLVHNVQVVKSVVDSATTAITMDGSVTFNLLYI